MELIPLKKALFILSSITYAMKGRDLLNSKGIKIEIKRVPKNKALSGCGYGFLVFDKAEKAAKILEKSQIKVLDIKKLEAK